MRTKLVYKDNKTTKILWGTISTEDNFFIYFITNDGFRFRVNKQNVISVKEKGDLNGQ